MANVVIPCSARDIIVQKITSVISLINIVSEYINNLDRDAGLALRAGIYLLEQVLDDIEQYVCKKQR